MEVSRLIMVNGDNVIFLPWQGLLCERGAVRAFLLQKGKMIHDLASQQKYFATHVWTRGRGTCHPAPAFG
jgi:hypothetical protein